jgi:hypothetical protein
MKSWLKEIYEQGKTMVGHTPFPNFYNVMYGGELIIEWGKYWLYERDDEGREQKLLEMACDTKTTRVIHKAIKEGIMPPSFPALYDVYSAGYENAEQRARAVGKFLEIKEPRPESKKSLTDLMRDATVGQGGVLSLTDSGIEWTIEGDEEMEFVMGKLGMTNSNAAIPQWRKTWKTIGSLATAGLHNKARMLTKQLAEELE